MIYFESLSFIQLAFLVAAIVTAFWFVIFAKVTLKVKLLRLIVLLVSSLMMMNPYMLSEGSLSKVILLDQSKSFDENNRSDLLSKAQRIFPDAKIIKFSDGIEENRQDLDQKNTRTDLENSILQSSAVNSDIILVSDGYENKGSVSSIYDSLVQKRIRIFPLVQEGALSAHDGCRLTEFQAPLVAPAKVAVNIQTIIVNDSSEECKGRAIIYQDEKILKEEPVKISSGGTQVVQTKSDPLLDGKRKLNAKFILEPKNSVQEKTRFLSTAKREKLLLLSGAKLDTRILLDLLRQQSYQVDDYTAEAGIPSALEFKEYSSVILNNLSLKQIDQSFPKALQQYVQNGGTLITVGGERSYGLGGYRDSALEQALPVFSLPPQTEQKRLNAAVQLVIDKSKSMEQQSRLDFVKLAAKEVIGTLKPDDYLGLIAFDNEPFVVIPINRLDAIRQQALSLVDRFFPSGATRLLKSLQLAGRNLERVPAGRKHIIILTDGRLPDAGPMYVELAKQLRITGITLSTVLISDEDGSYPLKDMAEVGGGVFYVTNNPTSIPRIFMQDIRVSTGEKTLRESVLYDIKRGPSGIKSTSLQQFPRLKGYVQTKAKENANVELLVSAPGMQPEPLLVSWKYDKGKAISFTSDLYGRWSDEWINWPSLGQFVVDLIKTNSTDKDQQSAIEFDVRTKLVGGNLNVELSIFSNLEISKVVSSLKTNDSKDSAQSLLMQQKAKGLYEVSYKIDKPGDFDLDFEINDSKLPTISFNVEENLIKDQLGMGINYPLLSDLASVTGGQVNPAQIPPRNDAIPKKEPLIKWLALLLVALILTEVFARERLR